MFKDRREAGRRLASKLLHYKNKEGVLVLGLSRGGVPVAFEVATSLNAPLDIFIVRRITIPESDLPVGAIASGNVAVLHNRLIAELGLTRSAVEDATEREAEELHRREELLRVGHPPAKIQGRQVIIVDEGMASGAAMRAAVISVKKQSPARIIVAAPVAAQNTGESFRRMVDEIVCFAVPQTFLSIGAWYENFAPTQDAEVQNLLDISGRLHSAA